LPFCADPAEGAEAFFYVKSFSVIAL